ENVPRQAYSEPQRTLKFFLTLDDYLAWLMFKWDKSSHVDCLGCLVSTILLPLLIFGFVTVVRLAFATQRMFSRDPSLGEEGVFLFLQTFAVLVVAVPLLAVAKPKKGGAVYRWRRTRYLKYLWGWAHLQMEQESLDFPMNCRLTLKPQGVLETCEF